MHIGDENICLFIFDSVSYRPSTSNLTTRILPILIFYISHHLYLSLTIPTIPLKKPLLVVPLAPGAFSVGFLFPPTFLSKADKCRGLTRRI